MDEKLLNIRQTAEFLGVSIDTLRRWDKNGKLAAIRNKRGAHRYYSKATLEVFSNDLLKLAKNWAAKGGKILQEFYCANSAIFQARMTSFQDLLIQSKKDIKIASLLAAVTGEIGNNSFDHNLGNWPDIPGIFFGYDIKRGVIVLADRGLGILKTLSRVKPKLKTHQEALKAAFTEIISGRAPEDRGNGLKFVRKVVSENPIDLFFQSGDAVLRIEGRKDEQLLIVASDSKIQGCLASIKF